jgi:hypothetical protein
MGTILLLMINVGLFSVVAISVYNLLPFNPAPSVDIICQVNGDNIILTHRGGDALSLDTKIGFSNNTGTKYIVVGDYLDAKSKEDGKWSVGEKIVYSNFNLLENQIRVMVIDPSSNSFILSATAPMVNSITVTTLDATSITMNSANLLMNYDLRTQSGSVRFTYCPNDGSWTNTSWISPSGSGSYNIIISSLSPVKMYYFKAQLLYNSTIIEGEQKSFTTLAIANNPPTVTTPDPTNGSTDISITTALLSITIQDPEGELFNWTITTTPNIGSNTGTAASNGTKTCTIVGLAYLTTYTWTVKAYNGHHWTNKSYTFTTQNAPVNNPPIITNPSPTNGSTNIPTTLTTLSITIQDPEGDHFNWTITTTPNIGSNSGTGTSNGTKTCTITGLTYSTVYTWIVKANDGHHWTNRSYVFTTAIVTVNLSASKDTFINEGDSYGNYGGQAYLRIGYAYTRRGLIQFDLSSLSGKTIDSAELRLYKYNYYTSGYNPVGRTYNTHRIIGSWTETGVTWNNKPSYNAGVTDSDTVPNNDNWMTWDVKSDIQAFASGTYTNYGWLIKDSVEPTNNACQSYFYSREYTGTTYDPVLIVTYH